MKRTLTLLASLCLLFVSCHKNPQAPAEPEKEPVYEEIDANSCRIDGTLYRITGNLGLDAAGDPADLSATETVTFSAFPSTYAQFALLRERLLGKRMGGAVALELMAFEMFRRDRTVGEPCLDLINYSSSLVSLKNILSQRFTQRRDTPSDDPYVQPYFVAAMLEGASIENKYQPSHPYSITVSWQERTPREELSGVTMYGDIYNVILNNVPGYARSSNPNRKIALHVDKEATPFVQVYSATAITTQVYSVRGWEDTLQ